MSILAIIPARGGSKGLPRKNVRPLCGRPLLAWSIDAAIESRHVTDILVSTDSDEIRASALMAGASVLRRPAALATDEATTDAVLVHVVQEQALRGARPDLVVLLQPTVPVRVPGLVDACIERLLERAADSLLTGYPLHFCWWNESPEYRYDPATKPSGTGRPLPPTWRSQCPRRPRRQDMSHRELMWAEDGSVYVTRTGLLEQAGARLGGHQELFETERTVDIDTEEDFVMAEALMAYRQARVPA